MNDPEILSLFQDADALLEGHFILSSGLHSSLYLQCARVLMDPKRSEALCAAFLAKLSASQVVGADMSTIDMPGIDMPGIDMPGIDMPGIDMPGIDMVVSPAMGGVIVGYEVGRQLGVMAVFMERQEGRLHLRRGFDIPEGARVLMMEDVVTTGLSSRECIEAIEACGGKVVAAGALVDRSGGRADVGVPLVSLLTLDAPIFEADQVPEALRDIPAVKPGSRFLKR